MERALVWFKCAAAHDPVRPVIRQQAQIGWIARERKIDLTIESPLKADELLKRMKGWFTADVHKALDIFSAYGHLKILDDTELVIETRDAAQMAQLSAKLKQIFHEDVWVECIKRERLS